MLVQVSPATGPAGLVDPWFENWCCFSFSFVLNSAPQKPHWNPSQAWQTSCSPTGANILAKKMNVGGTESSPAQLGRLFAKTEPKFSTCGRSFAELAPGCCQSKRSHHGSCSQGGKQPTADSLLPLSLWHLLTACKNGTLVWGILVIFILPFRVPLHPLVGRCKFTSTLSTPLCTWSCESIFDRRANYQILGRKI